MSDRRATRRRRSRYLHCRGRHCNGRRAVSAAPLLPGYVSSPRPGRDFCLTAGPQTDHPQAYRDLLQSAPAADPQEALRPIIIAAREALHSVVRAMEEVRSGKEIGTEVFEAGIVR